MKGLIEKIYLSYYFMVRHDGKTSKITRTHIIVESVVVQLCAAFLFIIAGLTNFKFNNLYFLVVFLLVLWVISHLSGKIILRKDKVILFVKSSKNYEQDKRKTLAAIGVLSIIISFGIMIGAAIFMSYLWSLHKP